MNTTIRKTMSKINFDELFSKEKLAEIFPNHRADLFFDALYGDSSEGAYDILLVFVKQTDNNLLFEFHLTQRPGKCLACNLTYGLPQVFSRHPVIDVKGVVEKIGQAIDSHGEVVEWKLGSTKEIFRSLHVIPLTVLLG
jgi:hypothetical protein